MRIFISWSGDKSRMVAEALYEWLPFVIQGLEPWVSTNDIEKGTVWRTEIAGQLEAATVGIICLTSDNLEKPWLLFEAGALSKKLGESRVCTYLLGIEPSDVKEPLAQFQATKATLEDTRKLLQTINRAQNESVLPQERLNSIFDKWWPDLEQRLQNIPDFVAKAKNQRSEREMIEEILLTVRFISQADQNNKLSILSPVESQSLNSFIEPGKEVEAILQEVKSLNRPLVQMALEEATDLQYQDGKLFVTLAKKDAIYKRIEDSGVLFRTIGERLFGHPIRIQMLLKPEG